MKIKSGLETEYAEYKECNSSDFYGLGVIDFSERWAELMETHIDNGEALEEFAASCVDAADTDGITGYMYSCAVSALSKFWVHGELLRRWHNKDVQIRDEGDRANETGGVLNTAVIVVE